MRDMKRQSKYQEHCELLLAHIYNLCEYGRLHTCKATTQRLAQVFEQPISERQIYRYLKTLKDEKLIEVSTSKLKKDAKTKSLYKTREIKVLCTEPKLSSKVPRTSLQLPQQFYLVDKPKKIISAKTQIKEVKVVEAEPARPKATTTSKVIICDPEPCEVAVAEALAEIRAKKKMIIPAKVVPEPAPVKKESDTEFWAKIDKQMTAQGYVRRVHPRQELGRYEMIEHPELNLKEASEKVAEREKTEREAEFEFMVKMEWDRYQRDYSRELLDTMSPNKEYDDPMEGLWQEHLANKQRVEEAKALMELEEGMEYEPKEWLEIKYNRLLEEVQVTAGNAFKKNNEFWLSIYLGGVFKKEVKLKEYVWWADKPDVMKLFEQEYGKIHFSEE